MVLSEVHFGGTCFPATSLFTYIFQFQIPNFRPILGYKL